MLHYLSLSSRILIDRAKEKGYTVTMLYENKNMFAISKGSKEIIFKGLALDNSLSKSRICTDKALTNALLDHWRYPTVKNTIYNISEKEQIIEAILSRNNSVIIKPLDSAHGNGVFLWNIVDGKSKLSNFIDIAAGFSGDKRTLIVQDYIQEEDYRFLVLFGECMYVSHRMKPEVIGNGKSTIMELIEELNDSPDRSDRQYSTVRTKIKLSEDLLFTLQQQHVDYNTILNSGERIYLSFKCNSATGGTGERITNRVSPVLIKQFEELAKKIGLEFIAIDVFHHDLEKCSDISETKILELNSCPGFFTPEKELNEKIVDRILAHKLG